MKYIGLVRFSKFSHFYWKPVYCHQPASPIFIYLFKKQSTNTAYNILGILCYNVQGNAASKNKVRKKKKMENYSWKICNWKENVSN